MAGWVLGAIRDRSTVTVMTLYKSLIRSKVNYCCPLWNPSKIKDIQILENVQKYFTIRISGPQTCDYWEHVKELKLQYQQMQRERYSIIQIWKMIHGYAPNNILNWHRVHDSARLGVTARIPIFNNKA